MNYESLCKTCLFSGDCERCQADGDKVFLCEEYRPQNSDPPPDNSLHSKENSNLNLSGLCKICGNRYTCDIPKPEGGIWHCENFC